MKAINWNKIAENEAQVKQGWQQVYTQQTMISALINGLKFRQRANGHLDLLKTDLWTEGVATSREVMAESIKQIRGHTVTAHGMDIASFTCKKALGNRVPSSVAQADIRRLPYKKETFDVILDPSTIDHVPFRDAAQALCNYHYCLKHDGILAMIFAHKDGTLTKGKENGETYYTFDVERMRKLLGWTRFEIKMEYAIHCLNTLPLGYLLPLSKKIGHEALLLKGFIFLETWPWLSRNLLKRFAPLYVMIARKP